jgi:membrane-associated phospholipid phosphatase
MLKRFLLPLICCWPLACAQNLAFAQDYAGQPDDPGQLVLPDAPTPMALANEPARMARPDESGRMALPEDPGQTTRPAVDTTTGVPQREATWRSLPGDFLHDQKDLWMFPWQLAKGHHWVPTLLILGPTVGLIYADQKDAPYFRNHQANWDDVNDVFDPLITTGEVIALPAGLMSAGYIRHDDREVNTALLAAEAYGDSLIINLAMKAVTRRLRPSDVPIGGDFSDTFFKGSKSPLKGSSFPSGHATAVWSVATVVAERYRHRGKPWIPVLCYTLATAISFSRITESAHFPSDVWLGSALGYTIAKYQTLKPR